MSFGYFTLTVDANAYGGAPATGYVQVDGVPQVVKDTAGNKVEVGPRKVTLDPALGTATVQLPSDSTTGNSTGVFYRASLHLKHQPDAGTVEFSAPPIGSTVAFADLVPATPPTTFDEAVTTVTASGATGPVTVTDEMWYDLTLDQDATISLFNGTGRQKCQLHLIIRQDATGGHAVTWPANVTWAQGSPFPGRGPLAVSRFDMLTVDGGATWVGTGYGSVIRATTARRTTATVTFTTTTWTGFPTMDLVLAAKVGDTLHVGINGLWGSQASTGRLDTATMVGGNPVNWLSAQDGGVRSDFGVAAWLGLTGVFGPVGPSVLYTVKTGDISNGTVTLRFHGRLDAAGSKQLLAQAPPTGTPLDIWAVNLG